MRRKTWTAGLAAAVALGIWSAAPAQAHLAYYTGDDSISCWIPGGQDCYYKPGNVITHSYAFVSGRNNSGGSQAWLCPSIWDGTRRYECGWDFERYCYYAWNHSPDELDCHDQDGVGFLASVWNQSSGKTVGIHVLW